jgi:hypothetical protein
VEPAQVDRGSEPAGPAADDEDFAKPFVHRVVPPVPVVPVPDVPVPVPLVPVVVPLVPVEVPLVPVVEPLPMVPLPDSPDVVPPACEPSVPRVVAERLVPAGVTLFMLPVAPVVPVAPVAPGEVLLIVPGAPVTFGTVDGTSVGADEPVCPCDNVAPLVVLPTVPSGAVTPGVPMVPVAGATVPLTGAGPVMLRVVGAVTRLAPPVLTPVFTPVLTWPDAAGAAGVVTVWALAAEAPSMAARINAGFIFMACSFVYWCGDSVTPRCRAP